MVFLSPCFFLFTEDFTFFLCVFQKYYDGVRDRRVDRGRVGRGTGVGCTWKDWGMDKVKADWNMGLSSEPCLVGSTLLISFRIFWDLNINIYRRGVLGASLWRLKRMDEHWNEQGREVIEMEKICEIWLIIFEKQRFNKFGVYIKGILSH